MQTEWIEAFETEHKTVRDLCLKYEKPALEMLRALEGTGKVNVLGKNHVLSLFQELAGLEPMTVIVEKLGCIFEMKCAFPKGFEGYGYYNLSFEGLAGLGGHMDIARIGYVATTSEIFFNKPSKSWWFIHEDGHVIFKVYLGRDAEGNFAAPQLELFETWAAKTE